MGLNIGNSMIQVLLAEDHNLVCNSIKSILEKDDDLAIVAEATYGKQALELL